MYIEGCQAELTAHAPTTVRARGFAYPSTAAALTGLPCANKYRSQAEARDHGLRHRLAKGHVRRVSMEAAARWRATLFRWLDGLSPGLFQIAQGLRRCLRTSCRLCAHADHIMLLHVLWSMCRMTAAHALGAAVCKDELLTPSVWGSAARLAPGPAPEVSSTGRWSNSDAAAFVATASLASVCIACTCAVYIW